MKQKLSSLKPVLHWAILGGMLIFLVKAFKNHWHEVSAITIEPVGWLYLGSGLVVTLLAFTCAGWVWSWTLREFNQHLNSFWVIKVYLKTHIAKYLPGHLWHYYGRIRNVKNAGVSGNCHLKRSFRTIFNDSGGAIDDFSQQSVIWKYIPGCPKLDASSLFSGNSNHRPSQSFESLTQIYWEVEEKGYGWQC